MVNADQVARPLSSCSDSAFLNPLCECDRGAMTDLVEEFLCSMLDEQEEGKQKFIKYSSKIHH